MAGPERWDKRRSGRTTKMLAHAMRKCFHDHHAHVVIANSAEFNYLAGILADMGATRINRSHLSAEFGAGCVIQFHVWNPDRDIFGHDFDLKGIHPECVFWDHEAVRRKHNQIIQRYHEYD